MPFIETQCEVFLNLSLVIFSIHCIVLIHVKTPAWSFPGFVVSYDISKPVGQRVASVSVRCADCRSPQYEPLEEEKVYKVWAPTFLANGGDGHVVIKQNQLKITSGKNNICIIDLIALYNLIFFVTMGWLLYQGIQPIRSLLDNFSANQKRVCQFLLPQPIRCQLDSISARPFRPNGRAVLFCYLCI